MKEIKAIITDLDGTLLDSNKQVSEYTRHILKKAKENGIQICLATGRCPESVEYKLSEWGLKGLVRFILAMNGSVIYDLQEKIKTDYYLMDGEELISVVEHFEDLPVIFQVLYGPGRYTSKITPEWIRRTKMFGESLIQVDIKEFLKNRSMNKFFMICDEKDMPVILERASRLKNERLYGFPSGRDCYEYVDHRISKGFAIQKLTQYLGIDLDNCIAFGDAGNDIEMIQSVGMGVAMKNGSDEIKRIAAYQTEYSNNEDGLARFINKYLCLTKKDRL